uniref:Uncharacterized protein n=1 Tax=Oryza meridionalis TaxID=40149 RepID=A0A0E0DKP8_9ORYZ
MLLAAGARKPKLRRASLLGLSIGRMKVEEKDFVLEPSAISVTFSLPPAVETTTVATASVPRYLAGTPPCLCKLQSAAAQTSPSPG